MPDPNIPVVPSSFSPEQKVFVQAIKGCLEILMGQGRNLEGDRALRVSEYQTGMANIQEWIPSTEPTVSGDAPDPPTNLVVSVGMWHHDLSWDIPVDEDGLISHIEVWVAKNSQLRDDANLVGIVTVTPEMRGKKGFFTYSDFSTSDDLTYWIRSVSYANYHSPWCPPDDQGGYVVVGGDSLPTIIQKVLDLLNGQITTDQLHLLLSSEIEKITGDGEGSVNLRIENTRKGIQAQIDDLNSVEEYDPSLTPPKTYEPPALVKFNSKLYKCTNLTTGNLPTDTAYWHEVGNYSSLADVVDKNSSLIIAINDVSTTSSSASARKLAGMYAELTDPDTGLAKAHAEILKEAQTRANADGAFAEDVETLDASFNHPETGLSTTVTDLWVSHANLSKSVEVWADKTGAGAKDITEMSIQVGNNEAAISDIKGTIKDENGVYAWNKTTAGTAVGDLSTTVEQNLESINGIEGNASIKIDNNGHIIGIGLLSTKHDTGVVGTVEILADIFRIVTAGGTKTPFTIATVEGASTLALNGNMFADGTIFSNIIYAGKLRLDSDQAPSAAYEIPTGNWGNRTGHFACRSRTSELGFVCEKSNPGEGSAIFGYCSHQNQKGAGVAGYNQSLDHNESYGGFFQANGGIGVVGETGNILSYGIYTQDKLYAQGGVYPFTGSHIAYTNEVGIEVGQLVYSIDAWCFHISQNLLLVGKTVSRRNKRVVGVVSLGYQPLMKHIAKNKLIEEQLEEGGEWTTKPEYKSYVDMLVEGDYQQISINSVGEGGILVCSENGDIENGDYLCSADTPGHAMRQDDDLLHNYTAAKALEAVTWADEPGTTKLIACTYHCG
ncbi:MAG: hypothetical protein GY737_13845 [Desulfobacteraceae bacterium]|nr:hypothetical protein [Desulfobacteraceae bacterium]